MTEETRDEPVPLAAATAALSAVIPRMPGGHPFFGHAFQLRRHPLDFVQSLRAEGDVVTFRLGPQRAYAVNRPDLIRQMLVADAKKFEKGKMFEKGRLVARNGLFTSEGDFHLRQRRIIQPLFHHSSIARYTATMREVAQSRVDSWRDGQEVLMDQEMFSLALATVTKVLFAAEIRDQWSAAVQQSLPVLLEGLARRALAPIDLLDKLPTPMNRRFSKALRVLENVVNSIIDASRADRAESGDLLGALLRARDEQTGEGMSDQQVYDEVVTMLIAGTETTAGVLSWACYLLSRHPQALRRLQAELDETLGDREARYADLGNLRYLQQVIAETLRLHPPTWMLMRRPVADVALGRWTIPAGSMVLFSIYALQRDPAFYELPELFDPDRWAPERAADIQRGTYIPFGSGVRGCAGEQFARAEIAIILSVILRNYSLHPARARPVEPIVRLLVTPSAIPLVIERRPAGGEHQELRWVLSRTRSPGQSPTLPGSTPPHTGMPPT
jgi:cytochrome P450